MHKTRLFVLASFVFLLFCMRPLPGVGQPNANVKVPASSVPFEYGVNPGYYGNGWTDKDVADASIKAGSFSFRASLPGYFVEQWGYGIRVSEFNYYTQTLGMKGITVFVGEPSDNQVDKTVYPPETAHSLIFKDIYLPVWDNGENGTPVNEQNIFATYVYNLVLNYGSNVQYWEIINEPDYTPFWDNANRSLPNNWYDNPPSPAEMVNLKAPIFYYIRMLRIAYEVIKKVTPNAYITPGGLGYPAFLDALLRYTDNPDGGKVTSEYPLKGGAYFDALSYHSYPSVNLSVWDNAIGGRRWFRHSDGAADAMIDLKNSFYDVLKKYGYDGTTYPAKPCILTEFNIPRKPFGNIYGGEEAQRNFDIKAYVYAQKNGIGQAYLFTTAESKPLDQATVYHQAMGLYETFTRDKKGAEKFTQAGKAVKTTSQLLRGWTYDKARSDALGLPAKIGGAAFKKGDQYRYVLWAKTTTDLSETAQATYSFPAPLNIAALRRYEWDYAVQASSKSDVGAQNISLTGTPSFFEVTAVMGTPLPVHIISFDARPAGCGAEISWDVSFKDAGNKLKIEESTDNKTFSSVFSTTLTNATAKGTFHSDIEAGGTKMYRLRVDNADGTSIYSQAKKVVPDCSTDTAEIVVFPNPAKDIIWMSGLEVNSVIDVFDNYGKKVRTVRVASWKEKVDLTGLPVAVYYLRIKYAKDNGVRTIKVVKE